MSSFSIWLPDPVSAPMSQVFLDLDKANCWMASLTQVWGCFSPYICLFLSFPLSCIRINPRPNTFLPDTYIHIESCWGFLSGIRIVSQVTTWIPDYLKMRPKWSFSGLSWELYICSCMSSFKSRFGVKRGSCYPCGGGRVTGVVMGECGLAGWVSLRNILLNSWVQQAGSLE